MMIHRAEEGKELLPQCFDVLNHLCSSVLGRVHNSCRHGHDHTAATTTTKTTTNTRHVDILFRAMDENGDGKVSGSELRRSLQRLGINGSYGKEEENEEEEDCYPEEFIHLWKEVESGQFPDDEAEDDIMLEAFRVFDRDGNGLISAAELQWVLAALGLGHCEDDACAAMIRRADLDGNGHVDLAEFKALLLSASTALHVD